MSWVIRLVLLWLAISLAGCSYFSKPAFLQTQDKRYLTASSSSPLKIPPGLSSDAFDTYYPVPNRYYPDNTKQISVVPPGLNSN
ncbi:MAG: hypothetical protein EPO11_07245 [Gammaproteobacteria bacterium]|nr:MAG: hypothetical protein EPO11_07245 [Gammaproteobacteria bacterium]